MMAVQEYSGPHIRKASGSSGQHTQQSQLPVGNPHVPAEKRPLVADTHTGRNVAMQSTAEHT